MQLGQRGDTQQQWHKLVRQPRPRAVSAPREALALLDGSVTKSRERYAHEGHGSKDHATQRDPSGSRSQTDREEGSGQRRTVSGTSKNRQPQGCEERKRKRRNRGDGRFHSLNRHELRHASPAGGQDRQFERLAL